MILHKWKWLCLNCVVVLLFGGCGKEDQKVGLDLEAGQLVKTMVLGEQAGGRLRSYPGKVVASQRVDLAFQVAGQLVEFPVVNGQKVAKGEMLAELDARDYQNQFNEANASFTKATLEFERSEKLLVTGAVSEALHDKNIAAYEMAKAKLGVAEKALDDTVLKAPFSGRVANTLVENYQNVQAKQAILSLQDISSVDIVINVPEQDLLFVQASDKERIGESWVTFDALPEREFTVDFKELAIEAEGASNTYAVTLSMPAPMDVNILPGMSATFVMMPESVTSGVYLVPVNAVMTDGEGNHYVWVVLKETQTVQKREVVVGQLTEGNLEVLQNLEEGEMIVTAGVSQLQEGELVRFWERD